MAKRLADGRLGGACLDVFTTEPLPVDSPLRDLDNVVRTPHVGWTVDRVLHEFAEDTVAHVMAYLEGRLKREVLLTPTRRTSTVAARDRSQTETISGQPTDSSGLSG